MSEINWDHVVTEPEHLKELKAYCCDQCGYTLFPARGTLRGDRPSGWRVSADSGCPYPVRDCVDVDRF